MPTKKYRVDTDKGSFMVEVDEPAVPSGFSNRLDSTIKQSGDDSPAGESPSFMDNLINNPMLKGASRPESLGDILSLILPTGGGSAIARGFTSRAGQALKGAAQETTGITKLPTLPFRAISKFNQELPSTGMPTIKGFYGGRPRTGYGSVGQSGPSMPADPEVGQTIEALRAPQTPEIYSNRPSGGLGRPPTGPTPSGLGESASVPSPTEQVSGSSALSGAASPQVAGTRAPQSPIGELVKPSRSSAGAGPDGLTEADRAAAGINPALRITKAPQSTADLINSARGARRQLYVTGAEQESVRQSSMLRDPGGPEDIDPEMLDELLRLMRGEQ